MPTPLSFLVGSGRPAKTRVDDPERSDLIVDFILSRAGTISRPVDVARALKRYGLSLKEAHGVLDAVVGDQAVPVVLRGIKLRIVAELRDLGVEARQTNS